MELEQAINNIKAALENFVGTKQQHIILEESLNTILKQLNNGTNN
jgi:predicted RNase H-like HicB family nuclease